MHRVLIVEDDRNLANTMSTLLITDGYDVVVEHDGSVGLEKALSEPFDVILLDVMLPGVDGLTICKQVKHSNITTPIIMISARGEVAHRIAGLDGGADDYVAKPFSTQELLARIRATIRRSLALADNRLRFGNLEFDVEAGRLICGQNDIILSEKESLVMMELFRKPGNVCSKEFLLDTVWNNNIANRKVDINNVEAYVSFLRKKLNSIGCNVSINTLRKKGYQLAIEEK